MDTLIGRSSSFPAQVWQIKASNQVLGVLSHKQGKSSIDLLQNLNCNYQRLFRDIDSPMNLINIIPMKVSKMLFRSFDGIADKFGHPPCKLSLPNPASVTNLIRCATAEIIPAMMSMMSMLHQKQSIQADRTRPVLSSLHPSWLQ